MNTTLIEWVRNDDGTPGRSWNPVIGCSRISPGCGGMLLGPNGEEGGCYAEALAGIRFSANPKLPDWHGIATRDEEGNPHWTGKIRFLPERLNQPRRVRKGQRVFLCDMGDVFHAKVDDRWIAAVFGVMSATPRHSYYVLTKRDRGMRRWFDWAASFELEHGPPPTFVCETEAVNHGADIDRLEPSWPLPNVALGVTVDDRKHGVPRIQTLRETPAARRFLSVEPLLEDVGDLDLTGIDLAIVGGESGKGSRPFDLRWALRIQAQCDEQGVGFFFKQAGDAPQGESGLIQLRKKKGSDLSELPRELRRRDRLVFHGPKRWERDPSINTITSTSAA
jgi:protein gp37